MPDVNIYGCTEIFYDERRFSNTLLTSFIWLCIIISITSSKSKIYSVSGIIIKWLTSFETCQYFNVLYKPQIIPAMIDQTHLEQFSGVAGVSWRIHDNLTFSSHRRQSRRLRGNAKGKGLYEHNSDDTLTQRSPGAWEDYLYQIKTTTVGYFNPGNNPFEYLIIIARIFKEME